MATTDTRTGFRLPWSSDRAQEGEEPKADAPGGSVAQDQPTQDHETPADAGGAWPEADLSSRDAATNPEAHVAATQEAAPAPRPVRKPSKLMADLTAAMRATAETSREQSLAQIEGDAKVVVEGIREHSTEGEATLRRRSEEDIAGIRDWSKAEIARIREETDRRITDRKATLDRELSAHAAAIEQRVEEVQTAVAGYETQMAAFFERLLEETDPAEFAAYAESMPEPPSLDSFIDIDDLDLTPADDAPGAGAGTVEPEAVEVTEAEAEPGAEAAAQAVGETSAEAPPDMAVETAAEALAEDESSGPEAVAEGADAGAWTSDEHAWFASGEDAPTGGWAPDGGSGTTETGDPVDRSAIMAALEAAAEAVVAAEAAAESADQAETAAGVAETAAELLVGRVDGEGDGSDAEELDPEAQAAMAARLSAFEAEGSFADRLAGLLPGHAEASGDTEPHSTQVVVAGLVSVASIASFKRHLGRIAGVTGVTVSSGPEGEFLFTVAHRGDVAFRDIVPSLPGFAARITGTSDGVVLVAARDPESEG